MRRNVPLHVDRRPTLCTSSSRGYPAHLVGRLRVTRNGEVYLDGTHVATISKRGTMWTVNNGIQVYETRREAVEAALE